MPGSSPGMTSGFYRPSTFPRCRKFRNRHCEERSFRRVGKGALAPCPPHGVNWWARCALPTLRKSPISNARSSSRREASEALMNLPPKEGVGNAGCPWHPQPRVRFALVEMHTSKRVPRNHPTFPHAMVLTVSFVLSPVTGLVCHRRLRICFCLSPVGPTQPPRT